ncbi:MAG: helix-turn-helix domain-containing protein [Weeksellaceae bacterium]|nr:helix-turn-helix domain-containing protein [Weeksellaceae bacterium]
MDDHLKNVLSGQCEEIDEIKAVADKMHLHPRHFSNTIKIATGQSPCSIVENKIIDIAKQHLKQNQMTIGKIDRMLTYDSCNFTTFFKRYVGITPKQHRENCLRHVNFFSR